jgi:hypothetical protein
MSISKRWIEQPANREQVMELYRSRDFPTLVEIAKTLGQTTATISHILRHYMPQPERKALATLRYSMSKMGDKNPMKTIHFLQARDSDSIAFKMGDKNPMKGKTGEAHHRWIGECDDGYGYLTCLHNGKRQFVHRVVMAEALGLPELPTRLDVHHIDSDPKNNSLDNLALVTKQGHKTIHFLQARDSDSIAFKRSTIAEIFQSTISR